MVVSMIQVVFELPEATSLKEKRQTLRSLKDRLIRKYKVSVAEIDLQATSKLRDQHKNAFKAEGLPPGSGK